MGWEYVAVDDRPAAKARRDMLIDRGWKEWMRIPWHGLSGEVCIMRRPKDEPRMWTKGEIEEISLAYHNLQLERLTMEVNAKTDKEETNG